MSLAFLAALSTRGGTRGGGAGGKLSPTAVGGDPEGSCGGEDCGGKVESEGLCELAFSIQTFSYIVFKMFSCVNQVRLYLWYLLWLSSSKRRI